MTTKLRLIMEVDYNLNGERKDVIKDLLNRVGFHLAEEGLLTGNTQAEVICWDAKIQEGRSSPVLETLWIDD